MKKIEIPSTKGLNFSDAYSDERADDVFFLMALMGRCVALPALEWKPERPSLERYEHIWKSAPFVAAAEVTPKGESIVQRYAVTGFARIGDSDVVFLFDRQGLNRFSVAKGDVDQGVELLEITEQSDLQHLHARIRADGEIADISYDASLTASPVQPAAGGGSQPQVTRPNPPPQPKRIIRRRPINVHFRSVNHIKLKSDENNTNIRTEVSLVQFHEKPGSPLPR